MEASVRRDNSSYSSGRRQSEAEKFTNKLLSESEKASSGSGAPLKLLGASHLSRTGGEPVENMWNTESWMGV